MDEPAGLTVFGASALRFSAHSGAFMVSPSNLVSNERREVLKGVPRTSFPRNLAALLSKALKVSFSSN